MYQIYETEKAIKEVQRMLGLNTTGVYEKRTRTAVTDLQEKYKTQKSGIVDYNTFTLIAEEYRKKNTTRADGFLFYAVYPFTSGDQGENITKIHSVMKVVLENYEYEGVIPNGNFFGSDTVNGIRYLRKILNINGRDEIDKILLNRIILESDAIELKKKYWI